MTYLVLARKYRPKKFADLVGQEHVVRTLQNAIRKNRVTHAYIFAGGRGVGKTTTARILAKALNCADGPAVEPCDRCASCLEISEGRSLDFIEIDGASNRGIDEVRELRENVKFAPARSRFKIYLIDEVHMLTEHAFNALLKTLEEPPPHVKFFFATTDADRLPVTIRSRCQRFDFRLLTREEIVAQLEKIAAAEGVSVGRRALAEVARAAEGSLRDSESLLEQVIAFAGDEPGDADVEEVLHLVSGEVIDRFLRGVAVRDTADLIRLIDDITGRGHDLRRFLAEITEWVRGMVLVSVDPSLAGLVPLVEEDRLLLTERARGFSKGRLLALVRAVMEAEREIKNTATPRMIMELLALKMAQADDFDALDGLIARVEALAGGSPLVLPARPVAAEAAPKGGARPVVSGSRRESPPPTRAPEAPRTQPVVPEETDDGPGEPFCLTPDDPPPPNDDWNRFLEAVKERKATLGAFLEHGRPTGQDTRRLTVTFSRANRFFYDGLREPANLAILQEIAAVVLGPGSHVGIEYLEGEDAAGAPLPAPSDLAKKKHREALRHPLVRELLDRFGGQVKEVRPLTTMDVPEEGDPS
jgi:DNA polymerase-3 subunit gamma/tau